MLFLIFIIKTLIPCQVIYVIRCCSWDSEVGPIIIILLPTGAMIFERLSEVPKVSKLMVTLLLKFKYTYCQNLGSYCFTIVPAKGSVLF